MAEIGFHFFGPPRFCLDGAPARIPRRKAVALAVYLAVTGELHSREKLAAMFWPESDAGRSRASLRKALSLVTKALGRSWLAIDRQTIGFVPHQGIWVDVNRFRTLAGPARNRTGDAPEIMAGLEEAADLCRRSFLSGFSVGDAPDFDDWQFEQAEQLAREAAGILGGLARWRADRGEYPAAVDHARRRVALDPLDEVAQRQLIRIWAAAGRPGPALRQFEQCRSLLEKELGVEPDKMTLALAESIGKSPESSGGIQDSLPSLPVTNLPAQSSRFLGRADEMAALAGQLARPDVRLLTLTGPGGTGKTRLALALASSLTQGEYHGVFFVSLAALPSREALVRELLRVAGVRFDRKTGAASQVFNFFRPKTVLLVMDNFEDLPAGARLVSELLEQAPGLKILATSRGRLMLRGEHLFPVAGLSVDRPAGGNAGLSDAAALFFSAAGQVTPGIRPDPAGLKAVARICGLTGGLPLALIMAARWAEFFPLDRIADEIENSLDFLAADMADVPDRHKSMRAVFDASWNRLDKAEKEILTAFSVFRDNFDANAAGQVAGVESAVALTAGLARKSLLEADSLAGRFQLHPLLRQYASERLAALPGRREFLLEAHKNHYLGLVHANEARLTSGQMPGCRQAMDADFANIRQAWLRAADQGDFKALTRAATGLYVYFDMHTLYHEGEALFRPVSRLIFDMPPAETAPCMGLLLLCWLDMAAQDRISADRASEIRALGRRWVRQALRSGDTGNRAVSLLLLGAVAQKEREYGRAIRFFRLGLGICPGTERAFWVLVRMGLCRQALGHMDKAIGYFNLAHGEGRKTGDRIKTAWAACQTGISELGRGRLEPAEASLVEAGDRFARINAPIGMVTAYGELGLIAFLNGKLDRADIWLDAAVTAATDRGLALSRYRYPLSLKGLIGIAAGRPARAKACLERAMKDGPPMLTVHLGMALCAATCGELRAADRHLALAAAAAANEHRPHLSALLILAEAAVEARRRRPGKPAALLRRLYDHPCCPTGLLAVWPLPELLLPGRV